MSRRLYTLCTSVAFLVLLTGCEPTSPARSPGFEYFPLDAGRYVVYDVQEQYYALNSAPIQRSYQLKEVTGPAYSDVTGQTAFQLTRYRRSSASEPWQADSIWSARLVNNEAIRTENGQDLVKLVFPVSDQLSWNGNRHTTREPDDYIIRNSNQPYRVSDKQFDQTATVLEQNDSTLVSQDKRLAVYAKTVGLIYKERTQLQFCSSTPACIGTYQIDYGIRQVYRINAYGRD
ncbi:hypothetical protein GCM10027341_56030 [Spirosoma knui]